MPTPFYPFEARRASSNMLNIESILFLLFLLPTIYQRSNRRLLETVHVETGWPVSPLYKMNRTTCHWSNARRPTQHAYKHGYTGNRERKRGLESNPKLAKVSSYATFRARLSIATVVVFLYTFPPG